MGVFCTALDACNVVHTTKSEVDHVSMYPQSGGVSKGGGSCHEWDYPIQVIAYLQVPCPGNFICLSSCTFRNLTNYCPHKLSDSLYKKYIYFTVNESFSSLKEDKKQSW